jgi:hypothetical protein
MELMNIYTPNWTFGRIRMEKLQVVGGSIACIRLRL